jgi:glycosyltransferase involved in cell wall biosynthesis
LVKVLYCILDNRLGGPHRRAQAVAGHLRRHGVETLFLFGRKTPDLWRPEGFEAFWCRHIQCFARRRSVLNVARFCCMLPCNLVRIRRLLKSRGIEIVHVDGVTNFVPALAARWAGIPIVWHYNDHLPGPLKRILLPLVSRLSATVIVQGEGLKESRTAGNRRLRDKTRVLYSAVDPAALVPEAYDRAERERVRAELGIPADGLLIGAVGNLNRFKGYTYFLQAAAKIKTQMAAKPVSRASRPPGEGGTFSTQPTRVRFLVVGRQLETDGAYWEHLLQLTAKLGLAEDVVFAGFRVDIPRILAALDVFVLPSVLESCPVTLLEAMAMKTPVVATDVGSVREIVDHDRTGIVTPPGDAGALAEAVLDVLAMSPEQVQAMVAGARKTVEQRFTVDTIARQQLQVYQSLHRPPVCHV